MKTKPKTKSKICGILRGGEREKYVSLSLSPLSLSRKNSPFIKNCETRLIRGRKSIRVTQILLKIKVNHKTYAIFSCSSDLPHSIMFDDHC